MAARAERYRQPAWWQTEHTRHAFANILAYALLSVLTLLILFPFLWLLLSALRPNDRLYSGELFPWPLTLDNFGWALVQPSFLLPLRNSFIVATSTALLSVTLCSLAAFSLTRYSYRGKTLFTILILMINLLPAVLLVIPIFLLFRMLGLYNSYAGLVLAATTFSAPASMLLLRGIFSSLPGELVDAALIDGCTRLGALVRIVLPLAMPGIVTVVMFAFVLVWNDVLYALVLTRDVSTQTVSVALNTQAQAQFSVVNWAGLLAEGVLITLPILLMFAFLQRYLVQGIATVGLK